MHNLPPTEWYRDLPLKDIPGVIGRFLVMKELRLNFTDSKTRQIARDEMPENRFWGAIHRTHLGLHGGGEGLHLADVEIAATYLGVFDETLGYMDERKAA